MPYGDRARALIERVLDVLERKGIEFIEDGVRLVRPRKKP
jgi:hypothetical protein